MSAFTEAEIEYLLGLRYRLAGSMRERLARLGRCLGVIASIPEVVSRSRAHGPENDYL